MVNVVNLQETGSGWEFESEAALEDFLWENLETLFGLHCLKRQPSVNKQFCDIVAVGKDKQLVVLELKNTEDRYVVQQLTRYYDALVEEKAFSDEVDYQKPVRLVAIAPSFHRDNFTDRKYHTLTFEFWTFSVIEEDKKLYFNLMDLETDRHFKLQVDYQKLSSMNSIPDPPRKLLKILNQEAYQEQRTMILEIRNKILSFDKQIQELPNPSGIKYGNKQTHCCAEVYLKKSTYSDYYLFLWLPKIVNFTTNNQRKRMRLRLQLFTGFNAGNFGLQHFPNKGLKRSKSRSQNFWFAEDYIKQLETNQYKFEEAIQSDLSEFAAEKSSKLIYYLVDIALHEWRKKL